MVVPDSGPYRPLNRFQNPRYLMAEHPLAHLARKDPAFFEHLMKSNELALSESGAIPRKYRLLMALTYDMAVGASNGIKALAGQALQAGATKEEIVEAIRIAHYLAGVGAVYTSVEVLKELF